MKMKAFTRVVCTVAFSSSSIVVVESREAVSPVEKVIQLLDGMLVKGDSELHAEEKQYLAYQTWCETTTADLKQQIMELHNVLDVEEAQLKDHEQNLEDLNARISSHQVDVGHHEGDKKASTAVRAITKEDYEALHKDYTETIEALGMAIQILSKQNYDRKQASLLQLSTLRLIPEETKRAIGVLMQEPSDAADHMSWEAPEANGYEFQSEHVIDMLKQLLSRFKDERTKAEQEEQDSIQSHEMLIADMNQRIESKTKSLEEMAARSANLKEDSARITTSQIEHTDELNGVSVELKDTASVCATKASDFTARQQLRQEELDAIRQAKEILASSEVLGAEKTHMPLAQSSLAQLRAESQETNRLKVVSFFEGKASKLKSVALTSLVLRVAEDPFVKVKEMIYALITRLEEEATSEATTKAWCDKELSTNEQARTRKTAEIEDLNADIDNLHASIAKLAEEIADLSAEISRLNSELADATKIRKKDSEENSATIEDAKAAQVAVAQATEILKDFYDKASGATALLQHGDNQPAIFDSPYTGMGGRSDGVIGLLEVIASDFAKLQSETETAESAAASEFETFSSDTRVTLSGHERDVHNKNHQKTEEQGTLENQKNELYQTEKELAAKNDEFEQLKPTCVNTGVTFEERDGARAEEIEALQEGLRILEGTQRE